MDTPPQDPAGPYLPLDVIDPELRRDLIAVVAAAPAALAGAVAGLGVTEYDTRYRKWTVRQIIHHLADSHINAYTRYRLALTEDRPTIKPYDESRWAELSDARDGDVAPSMALLDGLHARWAELLRGMTDEDFARSFFHPELQRVVRLDEALSLYAWHGRHHTAQIDWLRAQHGWANP